MRHSKVLVLIVGAAIMLVGACGGDDSSSPDTTEEAASLSVYAAAAVEPIVDEIAAAFEAENPGVQVEVATQDQEPMRAAVAEGSADIAILPDGWLTEPVPEVETGSFARNTAVIVVPEGNPKDITTLAAFGQGSDLRTQVCGEQTAVGRFIVAVLAQAGVTPDPATVASGCESDAAQKVADGDLDAALMYRFGLQVPDGAELVEVDAADNRDIDFSYFVLSDASQAEDFAAFLESDAVNTMLVENGYLP